MGRLHRLPNHAAGVYNLLCIWKRNSADFTLAEFSEVHLTRINTSIAYLGMRCWLLWAYGARVTCKVTTA
jgi:hypothetical protein